MRGRVDVIRAAALRTVLPWVGLAAAVGAPLLIAANSPLTAWRDPVYIAACLAGVLAMGLLLAQPLLAGGYMPRLQGRPGRRAHAAVGAALAAAVVVHVAGLWATSPPDVIDALLLRSPTPFSVWGVASMWAVFAAAALALMRRRAGLAPAVWRAVHATLAVVTVGGAVAHAMLIDGMMGDVSKAALCLLALAATVKVMRDRRPWAAWRRTA